MLRTRPSRVLTYLMTSSAAILSNGPKVTLTENIHPSVTFGENLRYIGCQMHPQGSLISTRGQKILCWKLSRWVCHFGSNGSIYIYFYFLYTVFFFFFLFNFFLTKYIFLNFLFLFLFYIVIFLINSNGPPYSSKAG